MKDRTAEKCSRLICRGKGLPMIETKTISISRGFSKASNLKIRQLLASWQARNKYLSPTFERNYYDVERTHSELRKGYPLEVSGGFGLWHAHVYHNNKWEMCRGQSFDTYKEALEAGRQYADTEYLWKEIQAEFKKVFDRFQREGVATEDIMTGLGDAIMAANLPCHPKRINEAIIALERIMMRI
jgi:hypothetical protein